MATNSSWTGPGRWKTGTTRVLSRKADELPQKTSRKSALEALDDFTFGFTITMICDQPRTGATANTAATRRSIRSLSIQNFVRGSILLSLKTDADLDQGEPR